MILALPRGGALLGLPSPWVALDPSCGLVESSLGLGLPLHLSKRNKSNTNLLFCVLGLQFFDWIPSCGRRVGGKVFDLLH